MEWVIYKLYYFARILYWKLEQGTCNIVCTRGKLCFICEFRIVYIIYIEYVKNLYLLVYIYYVVESEVCDKFHKFFSQKQGQIA